MESGSDRSFDVYSLIIILIASPPIASVFCNHILPHDRMLSDIHQIHFLSNVSECP